MEQDLEKQIKERFDKLPPAVQQAIQSADLEAKLQAIGQKDGLHIDQIGDLQDETLLVMMGLSDPGEFASRIEERLHLPPQKAVSIAEAISTQVFVPIRTSMQEFMEHQETGANVEVVKQAIANPSPAPTSATVPVSAKPNLSAAETMLQTKTVTVAPAPPQATKVAASLPSEASAKEGPKPAAYSADPYREPPM